ncbi:hypothetical protein LV28_25590 [Pandoraea pnomenusa]|nr:hypothetical protein LV28_25590 [Pandoraea pnomenusa]
MNAAIPGTCPPVVYFEADRGIYATEFASGETLERQLRDSVIDVMGSVCAEPERLNSALHL